MATRFEDKTDTELVEACVAGDSAAWESLIVRYERLIYSIPISQGMPPHEAADIFQRVCLILFRKLPTLRDYERISSWLITTTRRECWRTGAQLHRVAAPIQPADLDRFDADRTAERLAYEQCVSDERQLIVRNAIAKLPERCRELLTMLFYLNDDITYQEIAERMGMPLSSIGPTRARCLEKLKRALRGKL
jgi:RNA polymerase sigma factor (sigma-70 family)